MNTIATNKERVYQRRRRALAAVLLAPVACIIGFSALTVSPAGASDEHAAPLEEVTVHAGETLWSIAEEHADGRDVRDVMGDIQRINALSSTSLDPGQHLLLPAE